MYHNNYKYQKRSHALGMGIHMKILVVGGSYFYGRVFVMLAAKEHQVTVVNRGTFSMEEFGALQITGDRHDPATWRKCAENYDAVVDFCAYAPGDAAFVLEHLAGSVSRYLLISTVDVYERGTGIVKGEDAPLESRQFPGEAGAYISGKVALEGELLRECGKRGISWTILRPAILYGPYNYAPRESEFIRMAAKEHVLPQLTDADGRFQMVYVKDAAEAALRCLENDVSRDQAYNICPEESADYQLFFEAIIHALGEQVRREPMTAKEALEQRGILLPFPVYREETELCSGGKGKRELGLSYLSLFEGMERTCRALIK